MRAVIAVLVCATLQAQQNPAALIERFRKEPALDRQLDIAKEIVALNDPSVLPQLRPLLADPDRHLRGGAAFIFAGMGDRVGFDTIVEILNDTSPDRVRKPPNVFSGAIAKNAIPPPQSLVRQIHDDRFDAVYLLGELRDPRAIPVLIPLLTDPDINYEVPRALGKIGGQSALDGILLALKSYDPNVRVMAIDSIQRMNAKSALPQVRALLDDQAKASLGAQTVSEAAQRAIAALEK